MDHSHYGIVGHRKGWRFSCAILLAVLVLLLSPRSLSRGRTPSTSAPGWNAGRRLRHRANARRPAVLHEPQPRETAIVHDAAWEGNASGYVTVIQEGGRYRMYYRGHRFSVRSGKLTEAQPEVTCYAESSDGIHWQKPELGLFEWNGSKKNNIVWRGDGVHNFTPFLDTNPQTSADARYKAVGGTAPAGLFAFQSADGIHWKKLAPQPVFSKGAFDSQNVPFWTQPADTRSTIGSFLRESSRAGGRSG